MTCIQENTNIRLVNKRIVQLNIGPIDREPLKDFSHVMGRKSKLPSEALNMLFRRLADDLSTQRILVTEDVAFQYVSQLVIEHTKLSKRESFKLANAYCKIQYGFQLNLFRCYF